jgi:hypothetical protein
MNNMTRFLAHLDDERRLAHRSEKKRKIAALSVKRDRITELEAIIRRLNQDSETAAESHQIDAGRLQSELDTLDEQQVQCVLAGKPTPEKALKRRSEILSELAQLNNVLEMRCEANRRSIQPLQKQVESLRLEVAERQALQNQLIGLASVEIRRQRLFNDLKQRSAVALSNEIQRRLAIAERNVDVSRTNKNDEDLAIHSAQLEDYRWMLTQVASETAAIRATEEQLIQQALSE